MNDIVDILNAVKSSKDSVLKISKKTGISSDKLYYFLKNKSMPKADDFVKLQMWYEEELENTLFNPAFMAREPTEDYGGANPAAYELKKKDVEIQKLKEELETAYKTIKLMHETLEEQKRNSNEGKAGARRHSA